MVMSNYMPPLSFQILQLNKKAGPDTSGMACRIWKLRANEKYYHESFVRSSYDQTSQYCN